MNSIHILTLMKCENPFQWKIREEIESMPYNLIGKIQVEIDEKILNPDTAIEHIILHVALSYEYHMVGDVESALQQLDTGEEMLKLETNKIPNFGLNVAASHIIRSSKANILVQCERDAAQEIENIPRISEMDKKNQAALLGFKAIIYSEYGIAGNIIATDLAEKAINFDSNESFWHFLKGKCLSRIRRVSKPYDIPSNDEISSFETALTLKKDPLYLVFKAQVNRETASRIYRRFIYEGAMTPNLLYNLDTLIEQSLTQYEQSYQSRPNCPRMMFRCAKGLIMLPPATRDKKLIKHLLQKALLLSPESSYGNHVMAQYHLRISKNFTNAIHHLKICEKKKVFGAAMDLLQHNYRQFPQDNIFVSTLERYYDEYPDGVRRCQILSQLASFHLIKLKNLFKTCEYTQKAIRYDPLCHNFLEHRPAFIFVFHSFNLYDLIIDEVKILLHTTECSEEDRKFYQKFMKEVSSAGISVKLNPPEYLKQKLLTRINKLLTTRRKRCNPLPIDFNKYKLASKLSIPETEIDQNIRMLTRICKKIISEEKTSKSTTTTITPKVPSESNDCRLSHYPQEQSDDESDDDDLYNMKKRIIQKVTGRVIPVAVKTRDNCVKTEYDDVNIFHKSLHLNEKERNVDAFSNECAIQQSGNKDKCDKITVEENEDDAFELSNYDSDIDFKTARGNKRSINKKRVSTTELNYHGTWIDLSDSDISDLDSEVDFKTRKNFMNWRKSLNYSESEDDDDDEW